MKTPELVVEMGAELKRVGKEWGVAEWCVCMGRGRL